MYGNFTWWHGVVENRLDPLKLGRCQIRVLGYHTANVQDIPTDELPWATPVQPITSGAMTGVGTTPLGPVEGTWVVGFWRDGANAQEPCFFGTIGGYPQQVKKATETEEAIPAGGEITGFQDPNGVYPDKRYVANQEPDTNRLARGIGKMPLGKKNGENADSLVLKRKTRQKAVEIATAASLAGGDSPVIADNGDYYTLKTWNEPNPRYGGTSDSDTEFATEVSSKYPYNHVRAGECGHVEEWDDTPGAERLHTFHVSGTFEEIQADGSRITKIQGSDYEIVARDKDVLVSGNCNLTVMGDCKVKVKGTMVTEVDKDYHLNIKGDRRVYIGGNDCLSVNTDSKTAIGGHHDLSVGKDDFLSIGGNELIKITGTDTTMVTKDYSLYCQSNITQASTMSSMYFAATTMDINSLMNMGISTATSMDLYATTSMGIFSTGPMMQTSLSTYQLNVTLTSTHWIGGMEAHYVGGIFRVMSPLILLN